jgi:hypothetical protein
MTKYPALYAALEPDEVNGRRGFTVRCTATRRALGFIWWEVTTGTTVCWHWRTGQFFGERTTERNAVQALRDVSNASAQRPLPLGDDSPAPTPARKVREAHTAPQAAPAPTPAAPARRVVWNDEPEADITAALAAALKDLK